MTNQPNIDFYEEPLSAEALIDGLRETTALLDEGINQLQPAATMFAQNHRQQELKKLNIMKAVSVVEVDGEKMKNGDFIAGFEDLLSTALDKILSASKNSMRMALFLNAAQDGMGEIKTILADRGTSKLTSPLATFVHQISIDMKTCEEILKDIVCLDINETMQVQARLNGFLEAFKERNTQILQMAGDPPLTNRWMEQVLNAMAAELKNTRLAKYKIEKLIARINDGETNA